MRLLSLPPALLSLLAFTSALPHPKTSSKPQPLPLLIWHGLGDRFDADGLHSTGELAQEVHPGTFVYYIRTDEDGGNDRSNTFFGNVTTQIEQVCEALRHEPKLLDPEMKSLRVDALGFSQGGQFLRGLLERCEGLSIRSLVTFGSQHNGITQFQKCGTWDFLCKGAIAIAKNSAWSAYAQRKLVPAQYYRTLNETTGLATAEYLHYSNFLADVNNEREEDKSEAYAAKIASLEKFVMIVFEEDVTVIPKESGWFAEVNATSGEVTPLRERLMYKEDWLGLKRLDEREGLVFRNASGAHMELDDEILGETFREFFGPERESWDVRTHAQTTNGDFDEGTGWPSSLEREEYQKHQLLLDEAAQGRLRIDSGAQEDQDRVGRKGIWWCGHARAQAWWDSLWWWEKRRWEWEHITLPWRRTEWIPLNPSGSGP